MTEGSCMVWTIRCRLE